MSKKSIGRDALPEIMRISLKRVGENIQLARKKRCMSLEEMSQRTMVSIPTIRKIEDGSSAVSLGIFLQVLWVLQLHEGFENIADPAKDLIGNLQQKGRLPQRIHTQKDQEIDLDF